MPLPQTSIEPVLAHDWHVVADAARLDAGEWTTVLFDEPLEVSRDAQGRARVVRAGDGASLAACDFGTVYHESVEVLIERLRR